jgi:hypothetical protein
MNTKLLAALYIAANAAANLILIAVPLSFRAGASVAIAATFVALDITTRDALHDVWHGDRRRLGALIVGGALCSALINLAAWIQRREAERGRVAVAQMELWEAA